MHEITITRVFDAPVTVTFADLGDKTEMHFHQTGLTDEHQRACVHDGWSTALDKLAELVA